MRDEFDQLCKDVSYIKHVLTGNGTPERGVIVRLDRIEQTEKSRSRWAGAAIVAAIGAVVTAAWSKLTGG